MAGLHTAVWLFFLQKGVASLLTDPGALYLSLFAPLWVLCLLIFFAYASRKAEGLVDEFSGVHDKSEMLRLLEEQRSLAGREAYLFSIALIDLDDFKKVNDLHGHLAGDGVLKEFCFLLKQRLRKTDYMGRFGGDEFLLLFCFKQGREAIIGAERLRRVVEETPFKLRRLEIPITISLGVTEYRWPETCEEVLQRADKALYLSKAQGRNKATLL